MNHNWQNIKKPNHRDILRTVECQGCQLRQVIRVSDGESLSGNMLDLYPDCDSVHIALVMTT